MTSRVLARFDFDRLSFASFFSSARFSLCFFISFGAEVRTCLMWVGMTGKFCAAGVNQGATSTGTDSKSGMRAVSSGVESYITVSQLVTLMDVDVLTSKAITAALLIPIVCARLLSEPLGSGISFTVGAFRIEFTAAARWGR